MNFESHLPAFMLGVVFMLLTPGPTNTLLLVGGHQRGMRRGAALVLAEAAGYLTGISAWEIFLMSMQGRYPGFIFWARMGCACYIAVLAVKLWLGARLQMSAERKMITARDLYVATLLNPKGLIFASVIFPPLSFEDIRPYALSVLTFLALLLPIGLLWIRLGASLNRPGSAHANPVVLQRGASLVLGGFAAYIVVSAR